MTTLAQELIPLGPCAGCGRPRWLVPTCTCGHGVFSHDIGSRAGAKVRTACARGGCDCRMYEEVSADG